ncbi:MAG: L,D-transpeptidase family protein [Chloroflexota bacterium]|nr:L,D-transpeptidase family protein [Chloroflexota bacterium]
MSDRLLRYLRRAAILLVFFGFALAVSWQAISLFSREGQALAPVVGQFYVGENWMSTPTARPFPTPTATSLATWTPQPTSAPLDEDSHAPPLATPSPVLPTPEPFLIEVAEDHGIDPAGSFVIINQNSQRMSIVQDGYLLQELNISTGDPDRGWFTPAWSGEIGDFWGTFAANGVMADDAWFLFKASGSILIHSLPYTLTNSGEKLYQGMPDLGTFPASRGCIRLAPEQASWFSNWGPAGVAIVVLPWDGGTGREG